MTPYFFCTNQLGRTIIAFPILILFSVILVVYQPAFPQEAYAEEIEVLHYWDFDYISDGILTYVIDSKDPMFHKIVDTALREWETEIGVIKFAKTRGVDEADVYFQQVKQSVMMANVEKGAEDSTGYTEAYPEDFNIPTTSVQVHILEKLDKQTKYNVVKHEIGHVLGLDHSKEDNRLMTKPTASTDISPCERYMVLWINGFIDLIEQRRGHTTDDIDKMNDLCNVPDDNYRHTSASRNNDDDDDDDNNGNRDYDDDDYKDLKGYHPEPYPDELEAGVDFYWHDLDGDNTLTEFDADHMCDEDIIGEGNKDKANCKKLYEWIEYQYGYETEDTDYGEEDKYKDYGYDDYDE